MATTATGQQKRLVLIGLGSLLALLVFFFGQSVNQIIWIGLSEGLQQIASVVSLETLPALGNVVVWTMISAMSWQIGLTFIMYIAFLILGCVIVWQYRKVMKSEKLHSQWFDYLFLSALSVLCALPLTIFVLSLAFFGVFAFNIVQAFNNLSQVSTESVLGTWNSLLAILNEFTFTETSIQALVNLFPQITSAFAHIGDVVTIWLQSARFINELQITNTVLVVSKITGVALISIADAALIYQVTKGFKTTKISDEVESDVVVIEEVA